MKVSQAVISDTRGESSGLFGKMSERYEEELLA